MVVRLTSEQWLNGKIITANKKVVDGYVGIHTHEFYEMEYITSGSGIYMVNGTEYPAKPGTLFFMTPVDFHDVSAKNMERFSIRFSVNVCNPQYHSVLTARNMPVAMQIKEADKKVFEVWAEELVANVADDTFASLIINCIIAKINSITIKNSKPYMSPAGMAELYILAKFKDNPSLNEVAEYVGLAPSYFSALFKKTTGKNFREYVDNLRFEYAGKLLAFSDMTVSQICIESGFDEYTNFMRRFKNHFGVSPGKYREKYKDRNSEKQSVMADFTLVR